MKKKILIRKNEKKNGAEIWKICYCPFCIVRRENCITIQVLYCDWEGKARGRHGAGGARAGSAGSRRGLGARVDSRARRRAAGARGAAGWALLCAPGRASWASWVLVHPAWFSTWFFVSEFFLSHQMNTVHCKINFGKKSILNLIKIK